MLTPRTSVSLTLLAGVHVQADTYVREISTEVPVARFVLIPGAWLGAWAWKEVTPSLEKKGHSVYPVTLTGMGERVHLATNDVGMETATQDVLNVIKYNDLDDFVLVGHSFAGKVAAAVADRVHEKIEKIIYVDAFRPESVMGPQGGFDPTREFSLLRVVMRSHSPRRSSTASAGMSKAVTGNG